MALSDKYIWTNISPITEVTYDYDIDFLDSPAMSIPIKVADTTTAASFGEGRSTIFPSPGQGAVLYSSNSFDSGGWVQTLYTTSIDGGDTSYFDRPFGLGSNDLVAFEDAIVQGSDYAITAETWDRSENVDERLIRTKHGDGDSNGIYHNGLNVHVHAWHDNAGIARYTTASTATAAPYAVYKRGSIPYTYVNKIFGYHYEPETTFLQSYTFNGGEYFGYAFPSSADSLQKVFTFCDPIFFSDTNFTAWTSTVILSRDASATAGVVDAVPTGFTVELSLNGFAGYPADFLRLDWNPIAEPTISGTVMGNCVFFHGKVPGTIVYSLDSGATWVSSPTAYKYPVNSFTNEVRPAYLVSNGTYGASVHSEIEGNIFRLGIIFLRRDDSPKTPQLFEFDLTDDFGIPASELLSTPSSNAFARFNDKGELLVYFQVSTYTSQSGEFHARAYRMRQISPWP